MATEHNNGSELDPNTTGAATAELETEKVGTLGGDTDTPIEEAVEKITLVSGSPPIEGNGNEDESESESESENTESETSSSSSSAPDSGSNSDSDDEEEARHAVDVEVEEGEISGSDEEKIVSWSTVADDIDADDDCDVVGGPIRSKNELQVLSFFKKKKKLILKINIC